MSNGVGPVPLEPAEVRALGCLIEKQRTTPDQYPLTLNSLRLACNQSTNRDPVVDYDEATVRDAAQRLGARRFARIASGHGSRAPKYRHLLDQALGLEDGELFLLCVLMLRGPQTPGELKGRTERMHRFADIGELEATLERLIARGLARRLERRPGQKEQRYEQLLGGGGGEPASAAPAPADHLERPSPSAIAPSEGRSDDGVAARVEHLERELGELRALVDDLRAQLGA